MKLKNAVGAGLVKYLSLPAALFILITAGSSPAVAQRDRGVSDTLIGDLMKTKGKLIAEGRNTRPVGQFNIRTYRVEEIPLQKNVTVEIGRKSVDVNKAWRITVMGGPFPVRALPSVIWIDDVEIDNGIENASLTEISAITFDRSLLREGATIYLSYGEDKERRVELPEKLSLTGKK